MRLALSLELRPLPSTGITQLHEYYGPLRHPRAPGLSLAGVQLAIPGHALGLPVLRALSLCTCCHHYPGAADRRPLRSNHPPVSAFPGTTAGPARTTSFSRFARCSLALRPAHSRCHQFVTRFTRRLRPFRYLHDRSGCFRRVRVRRAGLSPTGERRLCTAHAESRRSCFRKPLKPRCLLSDPSAGDPRERRQRAPSGQLRFTPSS